MGKISAELRACCNRKNIKWKLLLTSWNCTLTRDCKEWFLDYRRGRSEKSPAVSSERNISMSCSAKCVMTKKRTSLKSTNEEGLSCYGFELAITFDPDVMGGRACIRRYARNGLPRDQLGCQRDVNQGNLGSLPIPRSRRCQRVSSLRGLVGGGCRIFGGTVLGMRADMGICITWLIKGYRSI